MKIGRAYERGTGVRSARGEAAKWYRAATAQGNAPSENYLGMLHMEGKGVPRDTVRGISLLGAAAGAGVLEALTNLGLMLASGRGVTPSEAEAAMWLRRAAERGDEDAAQALRDLQKKK
jgi:TPR repeat protein